jgi:methyltransferase (TIGR00027 family)
LRKGQASTTSSLVALLRALADGGLSHVRDFADPTAIRLMTPPWRLAGHAILRVARRAPQPARAPWVERSRDWVDFIALRTRVIDDAWHDAHQRGVAQLVILGAGLDGRAFRLTDLTDVSVFEVDHPSTQALKRDRAAGLRSGAREHRFVPIDFERDSLADALADAKQRADATTFWIWEGVTTYLTREAQEQTLSAIAARSAPGSRVAMTYVEPTGGPAQGLRLMRMLGEPHIGRMTRATASERLAGAGLRVIEDTGFDDWLERYTERPAGGRRVLRGRVAVAEK